jgi:hypothetical protein
VGVSRWSTSATATTTRTTRNPSQEPDRQPTKTGRLCGRRHLRAGPLSVGDDARLVGRFEG